MPLISWTHPHGSGTMAMGPFFSPGKLIDRNDKFDQSPQIWSGQSADFFWTSKLYSDEAINPQNTYSLCDEVNNLIPKKSKFWSDEAISFLVHNHVHVHVQGSDKDTGTGTDIISMHLFLSSWCVMESKAYVHVQRQPPLLQICCLSLYSLAAEHVFPI
jgi:hypothetical protein